MRTNTKPYIAPVYTAGGVAAYPHMSPIQALERSVLANLLWEDEFYEDGVSIGDRIKTLCAQVTPEQLAALAIKARSQFNLRHVPLLLLTQLVKHSRGKMVGDTITAVIQRADEIAEFMSLYLGGADRRITKVKIAKQVKRGLQAAFQKFDAYQLAKYDRDYSISLADVAFLVHAKPKKEEMTGLAAKAKPIIKSNYKRGEVARHLHSNLFKLVTGKLPRPDTWESKLVGGADKCETFTRQLKERKLGYLALLRNLRGMLEAGVDRDLVIKGIQERRGADRVLPFRYVAAARACPSLERYIDTALLESLAGAQKLPGRTVLLVDVSGSMDDPLSSKSDLKRIDAAATLASMVVGDDVRVFSFSDRLTECPYRLGMAGVDAIIKSQSHSSTRLAEAVTLLNTLQYDRIIVITDEQSTSYNRTPDPQGKGYMINVASNKNGVGYKKWTHIDGFSEQVLRYIFESESV